MNNQTDAEQDRDWLQRSNDELRAQNAELLEALEDFLDLPSGDSTIVFYCWFHDRCHDARKVIAKAKSL